MLECFLLFVLCWMHAIQCVALGSFDEWVVTNSIEFSDHAAKLRAAVQFNFTVNEVLRLSSAIPTATFELNLFAAMSPEEWQKHFQENISVARSGLVGSTAAAGSGLSEISFTDAQIQQARASTVDWQTGLNPKRMRAITRVKNQGQCGSCWAFSTIGALEAAWIIAGNAMSAFSEQSVLDCIQASQLNGCHGGAVEVLVDQLLTAPARPYEMNYEYLSYDGSSHACITVADQGPLVGKPSVAYAITYYPDQTMEDAMMAYVYFNGPVIASVKASGNEWKTYQGGILQCETPTQVDELDHGVLIVGYGKDEAGNAYWRIKNSWSPIWGETGYVRLLRGQQTCGIQFGPYSVGV